MDSHKKCYGCLSRYLYLVWVFGDKTNVSQNVQSLSHFVHLLVECIFIGFDKKTFYNENNADNNNKWLHRLIFDFVQWTENQIIKCSYGLVRKSSAAKTFSYLMKKYGLSE